MNLSISLFTKGKTARVKLNTSVITADLIIQFNQVLDQLEAENSYNLFLLEGQENFCLGIDPESFLLTEDSPHITIFQKWEKLCRRIEKLNMHTVIAIKGSCTAFGVSLMLACDINLVSDQTIFTIRESSQGFLPPIAILNLGKYIGLGRVKALVIEGRSFSSQEAQQWGMINYILPDHNFDTELNSYIEGIKINNKEAIKLNRRLLSEAYASSYEDFIGSYLAAQHRAINTEDFARIKHEVLYS